MSIWSRLGVSVALAALFAMAATAWLQSQKFYEVYRWGICAGLLGTGTVLWITGSVLRAKLRGQTTFGEEPPKLAVLLNVSYAGVMLVLFGLIVALIVPKEKTEPKAGVPPAKPTKKAVAAATNLASVAKKVEPRRVWPVLQLQGITHLKGKSSALINRRTYFAGERIGDVELAEVGRQSVVLKLGDETRVLKLK